MEYEDPKEISEFLRQEYVRGRNILTAKQIANIAEAVRKGQPIERIVYYLAREMDLSIDDAMLVMQNTMDSLQGVDPPAPSEDEVVDDLSAMQDEVRNWK